MTTHGKVFIVGAGPGDPGLLTLRALELIRDADCILHDHLISQRILSFAHRSCKIIYVGKADNMHVLPQEDINELICESALKYNKVVRLKGGDPHVFGRGGEEELCLVEKNIDFEVVPGISSSISALTYAGIPVTHRGIASSFAVITGHGASGNHDETNWAGYTAIDTLIFLMGVRNRKIIAQKLLEVGKEKELPVAFIEKATTQKQNVILTTLIELIEQNIEVKSPAVMVVGNVVNLHKQLDWFHPLQNFGIEHIDHEKLYQEKENEKA